MTVTRKIARWSALSLGAGASAVLWAASPTAAHTGAPAAGVVDGLLHPLTGADHLLAMLSVGMVAALGMSRRGMWSAPLAFLGGMLVGGLAGLAGAPLPGAEHLIVASVILLGFAIAGAMRGGGDWLLAALVVAGLAHGHAHGAEAPTSAHPVVYVAGFLGATISLHVLGLGIGAAIRQRRSVQIGFGAATVAAGALLMA